MKAAAAWTLLLAVLAAGRGCQTGGSSQKGGWLSGARGGQEQWTIRCLRSEAPGHAEYCKRLADLLRRVQGLRAGDVRVVTDPAGSAIYYGAYTKVPARDTGELVFPPAYQRDIELIRRLSYNQQTPFFYARPELLDHPGGSDRGRYDVSHAKGAYTLQVAIFYNTPTFHERRQAAEQYVELLRNEGIPAYYRHESARSFVFVGDFEASDIVKTPQGPRYGPRVENLIAQRKDEFTYVLENGYLVKHGGPGAPMEAPRSFLVPVPRGDASVESNW